MCAIFISFTCRYLAWFDYLVWSFMMIPGWPKWSNQAQLQVYFILSFLILSTICCLYSPRELAQISLFDVMNFKKSAGVVKLIQCWDNPCGHWVINLVIPDYLAVQLLWQNVCAQYDKLCVRFTGFIGYMVPTSHHFVAHDNCFTSVLHKSKYACSRDVSNS